MIWIWWGEKCGTPLRPYSSDSVKTTGLLPDVVSPLCRSPQSHMMGPWELREGCKWRRRAKRECCQVEAMSLLLSSLLSSPLSSALLCSATAFSLLGEIITRHQAPGPDIHRSEKQRERARLRERERERESEKTLIRCNRRGESDPNHRLLPRLPSLLHWRPTARSRRGHFPAGFRLVVGCGLVLTAVIVLLAPLPPSSSSSSSSSPTDRVADLRGIWALCSSPSDQRSCKASEAHSAPPRLHTTRVNPQESLKISFLRGTGQKRQVSDWIFFSLSLLCGYLPLSSARLQILFSRFFSLSLSFQSTVDAIFLGVFCQKKYLHISWHRLTAPREAVIPSVACVKCV